LQAALKAPSISGAVTTLSDRVAIAVLIPLCFMADVVGRLFPESSRITRAVTIIISAIVSADSCAMMCVQIVFAPPTDRADVAGRAAAASNGSTV